MTVNINILIGNFERRLLKGNYSTFIFIWESYVFSSTVVNSNNAPKLKMSPTALKQCEKPK